LARMHPRAALLAALLSVAAPRTADAQRAVDVERFRPALDYEGFLVFNGTSMPGHFRWSLGFFTDYAYRPLTLDGRDILTQRLAGDLQFQVGLGGRVALAAELPAVFYQTGASGFDAGPSVAAAALMDPRISARVRVYGDPGKDPPEVPSGVGIALLGAVTIPGGGDDAYAGAGLPTFELQAIADWHVAGLGAGLMLGYRHRLDEEPVYDDPGAPSVGRNALELGGGLKVPLPVEQRWLARLDVQGSTDFRSRDTTVFITDLGITWGDSALSVTGAVGAGLTGEVGRPLLRVMAGVRYSPVADDADGDGVPDAVDGCPHLAEDRDGFQDEDGCPEPDNDNDFVMDEDDRCPNEEALEGHDADMDGCTDP